MRLPLRLLPLRLLPLRLLPLRLLPLRLLPLRLLPLLLQLAAGCRPGDLMLLDIQPSPAVPTVTLVSWLAAPGASTAEVQFGPAGEHRWTAPAQLIDGRFSATLVGLPADSAGTLVALETVDGQLRASTPTDFVTGGLSSALPALSLTIAEDGHWADGFLLTTIVTNPAAAILVDPQGNIVWWAADDQADNIGRARLDPDGQSIWTMDINAFDLHDNSLRQVGLDGGELDRVDSGSSHHDFDLLPDGRRAWLSHAARSTNGQVELGDSLVVVAASGTPTTLWSVWSNGSTDAYETHQGSAALLALPSGAPAVSWAHCNALSWQDDRFLVGSLGLSAIFALNDQTGAAQWTFGGGQGDFVDPQGQVDLVDQQHQFQLLDDALLVFENGPTTRGSSRVVEFALDQDQGTATERWSYTPDPAVYTFSLGNPIRMDSGNTIANFATAGQIDEVTPQGQVLWRLSAPLGGALGYASWLPAVGAAADDGAW